ncbi:MAG: hypothetical protein AB7O24_28370 [Kofleriaceae bacterium]
MMLRALLFGLVVTSTTGAANPQPSRPCEVAVVEAPDDVRAEIESWIAAEPRCVTAIEIRVVATAEGLYLFARDARGVTRSRTVPDAATVAALVASWVADDSVDGLWTREVKPSTALAPAITPPGLVPSNEQPVSSPGRSMRIAGVMTGLAGLLALTGAAYYASESNQERISEYPADQAWPHNIDEIQQRGASYESRATALLATGATMLVTGTVLYLIGHSRAKQERVMVTPTVSAREGVGLAVGARF